MEEWVIKSLKEDLDGTEPRWLIEYAVPTEYAPDGVYSMSFPKEIFQNYAAIYGYDIDDPADMDELFDYIMHTAYLGEVYRRTGESVEKFHPYRNRPEVASAAIRAGLADFKKNRKISELAAPSIIRPDAGGRAMLLTDSVIDFLRRDLTIDRRAFAQKQADVHLTRVAVAMDMALHEDAVRVADQ